MAIKTKINPDQSGQKIESITSAQEDSSAEVRADALHREGALELLGFAVKWGKRIITWGACILIGFMIKIFISVADQFDNYSARPVAEAVGQGLGMLVKVLLAGAVCLVLISFLLEIFKGEKAPEKKAQKPGTSSQGFSQTDKRLSPPKTEAQKLLSNGK